MRLNEDTVLVSSVSTAVLVPYKDVHVALYHRWMQSPRLLQLTASEPLTIEEEYQNMRSWREDERKMTFIILDSSIGVNYMAGDVNLYILEQDEKEERVAEIEVMIATARSRRKGLAKDSLMMMMAYAVQHLLITTFVAKILEQNKPSIHLFSKALGFEEIRRVDAFGEIHYKLDVSCATAATLASTRETWQLLSFAESAYSRQPVHSDNPESTTTG